MYDFNAYKIKEKTVNEVFKETLFKIFLKGDMVDLGDDNYEHIPNKGKRSGGKTIELHNLIMVVENPSTNIKIPSSLSGVTQKFMDSMLYKTDDKPQSKRVLMQMENIKIQLDHKLQTRKASIAVWEQSDIRASYSVCLAYIQFLVRNDKLHQTAVFRSHDIWNGFLWNTKGNISLQEEISKDLNLEMGTYTELAVSAHVYEIDKENFLDYINYGFYGEK